MIVRYNPRLKEAFLRLARAVHAESRYRERFACSEKKLLAMLENPAIFCALSLKDGAATGFFLGAVQPMWFSEAKYGMDLTLYILPEHRGGAQAARLIREFEKFCREQGCVEIMLSSSAEISTELAERLYKKLGYRNCGFITRKDVI